ncbi:HEPN domain-containing protein [Candidatus Pacearchaeota archaeon]|nr:HEPN domain-containing protein [Candidatus Pacearchaeota archaeon]
MLKDEIKIDLKRAQEALKSAERNLQQEDLLTAANRLFVACENIAYVLLKSKFGSSSISRIKVLTRLGEINKEAKNLYTESYDLRVQADYGRQAKVTSLTKENMKNSLEKVKKLIEKTSLAISKDEEQKDDETEYSE